MVLFVACGLQMSAKAQENSPYSRYGLGDLTPNHNVFTRGMGGISAGIAERNVINFTNPASLSVINFGTYIKNGVAYYRKRSRVCKIDNVWFSDTG